MYEARKICNFLIAQSNTSFELTNLRINKLLYFIHGWALTRRPEGMVRNHFLAWQHGPVIRPVFDAFKKYGNRQILEPTSFFDYLSGESKVLSYDDIIESDAEMIIRIFEAYDRFSTSELVEITHQPGGPWDTVIRTCAQDGQPNLRIPNALIQKHFLGERTNTPSH